MDVAPTEHRAVPFLKSGTIPIQPPANAAGSHAAGVVDQRADPGPGVKGHTMSSISHTQDTATNENLLEQETPVDKADDTQSLRSNLGRWLRDDSPYIFMLLLAVVGVALRLPATYWFFITPVYAVICIVAGWRHFDTREARTELVYVQTLNWLALIVAISILYNTGVQGVLNTSASALAMLTLLALGTFTAGLQARVWRICALGAVLFLVVPTIGWLEQSVMFLVAAALVILALGGLTWWLGQRRERTS
jgi:hypothetical protein